MGLPVAWLAWALGVGGATYTPPSGLIAWYESTQGITDAGGGVVSQWDDQSGNGYHLTEATNRPSIATDFNGRQVIRFDNKQLGTTAFNIDFRSVSIFMVTRIANQGVNVLGVGGVDNSYAVGSGFFRQTGGSASTPITIYTAGINHTIKTRSNPTLIGFKSGGTGNTAAYNEYSSVTGLTAPTADVACNGIQVMAYNNTSRCSGDVYEILVYPTTVNPADVQTYVQNKYGLRSTDYTKQIMFEGDSITAGTIETTIQSYPWQVLRTANKDWRMYNIASSGATIASISANDGNDGTGVDAFIEGGYTRNVLMVLIGRNDVTVADNSATLYSSLSTYVSTRVAAGWEVWVGTLIASGGGLQTTIDELNKRIRGTTGNGIVTDAGATRVVDFAALPEFDAEADASNATYYQGDNTHPTVAGAAKMADLVATYL